MSIVYSINMAHQVGETRKAIVAVSMKAEIRCRSAGSDVSISVIPSTVMWNTYEGRGVLAALVVDPVAAAPWSTVGGKV